MRLIDTTPFDIKFMDVPDGTEDYKQGYIDGARHVLEEMDEAPTVDAVPFVHGKWVMIGGMKPPEYHHHHQCSACESYAPMRPPYGGREVLSPYCPACGAKMDLEELHG
jgi:hypothetical protein